MIYGYARVSTQAQAKDGNSLEAQKIALTETGATLDRVARNLTQGIELIESLAAKQIKVHVLNIGMIDTSPAGKLIRNVMLAFAEFERDMIVQRTQEGKSIAKSDPNFKEGRPKKFTSAQIEHAKELLQNHTLSQVESLTGISKSTLKRIKK